MEAEKLRAGESRRLLLDDAQRSSRFPVSAGEVREYLGHAALGHGVFGKLGDGGPEGSFINVLVHRFAIAEAFDDAEEHHEVHAAVTAHLQGQRPDSLPERVVVLFKNGGQFFFAFNPFMIISVAQFFAGYAGREAGQGAQGALDKVQAGADLFHPIPPGRCGPWWS